MLMFLKNPIKGAKVGKNDSLAELDKKGGYPRIN